MAEKGKSEILYLLLTGVCVNLFHLVYATGVNKETNLFCSCLQYYRNAWNRASSYFHQTHCWVYVHCNCVKVKLGALEN